ncbi:MAG TPA: histidine phosphotransferase family protein [Xanthobacteraceae bacterium]|nr:histidine phosphotransferase family protein [Xanthobacteraceae bacterium]
MSGPIASGPLALGALDLAALLCSRVCHDLISPVGAIVNGVEVLEEDKDEETQTFALDLIKKSAGQASARLQFCRLAFGAAGSAGAQVDTGDAETVARGLLEDDKTKISWNLPRELKPKNQVKLLLNMLIVACGGIPRGGRLTVDPVQDGAGYRITASGLNARVTAVVAELLSGNPTQPVDAHGIQPFYTGILARDCGLAVTAVAEGETVVVAAC